MPPTRHLQRVAGKALDAGPWPLLAWLLPAASVLLAMMAVGDLAYLIRAGQDMLDTGTVVRRDAFTFTMSGQPWLNQQWGAELFFASVHRLVGWRGLVFVRALIVGGVVGLTYVRARRAATSRAVAGVLTLGGFLVISAVPGAFALRPQLVAAVLFVTTCWTLDGRRARPARLLFMLPMGLLWANLHGSFVLLPVLLGLAFIADAVGSPKTAWFTGSLTLTTLLTPLLTPWGLDVYPYLIDVSSSPVVRTLIDEWRPLWTRWPAAPVFAVAVAVAIITVARRASRRPRFDEAVGLILFTGLAAWSSRNLLWWGLYVPPLLGRLLVGWHPGSPVSRRMTAIVGITMLSMLALGAVRVASDSSDTDLLTGAPDGVTLALDNLTGGGERVFAAHWGGWFEFAVTDVSMFVDSRAEFFSDEIWHQYFSVLRVEDDWVEILDGWGVDVVVLSPGRTPQLFAALDGSPGWSRGYVDSEGAIFLRESLRQRVAGVPRSP